MFIVTVSAIHRWLCSSTKHSSTCCHLHSHYLPPTSVLQSHSLYDCRCL